jgi:hypothetical protein
METALMFTGQVAAVSNRQDLELLYDIMDDDTGEAIDLTSSTLVFDICDQGCCSPRISATTDNGKITLIGSTVFRVFIPLAEMTGLCAGTYGIGCTVENEDQTESIIVGDIAILDGNVPR